MTETSDNTQVAVCIGTFDHSGIPISIAKNYLSSYAAIAFQTISLNMLISRSLALGASRTVYIKNQDGSIIRIERTAKGFVGYLEPCHSPQPVAPA